MDFIEFIIRSISIIILIFARITGFFTVAPIFGRREFPFIGKLIISLYISIIIYLTIIGQNYEIPDDMYIYTLIVISEFLVGFIIGYIVFLIFSAIYVAGQIIDMQMGFGVVNILDIQINVQVPIMGNFIYIITLLIMMTINGHHRILELLINSFNKLALGNITINDGFINILIELFSEMFVIAFKLSLPITAAIFLTNVALGVIARTVPQMNVFMIGFPLKIGIGLLVLILFLPIYMVILELMFNNIETGILRSIEAMI